MVDSQAADSLVVFVPAADIPAAEFPVVDDLGSCRPVDVCRVALFLAAAHLLPVVVFLAVARRLPAVAFPAAAHLLPAVAFPAAVHHLPAVAFPDRPVDRSLVAVSVDRRRPAACLPRGVPEWVESKDDSVGNLLRRRHLVVLLARSVDQGSKSYSVVPV